MQLQAFQAQKTPVVWELLNGEASVSLRIGTVVRHEGRAGRPGQEALGTGGRKCLTWVYGDASSFRKKQGGHYAP